MYSFGRRIATRVDGTLYYIHQDHPSTSSGHSLGSTVALSDAAGQAVGRVQYDPYGEVITSTIISSGVAASKVISASKASHEVTLEAWVKPANTTQDGPARIVTLSPDLYNRNFTLGQGLWGSQPSDLYNVRLRTTTTGNNGDNPSVSTPAGSLSTDLTHVVYTRDAAGQARVYLDNVEVVSATIGGDLSNWDETYPLALANELTEDRPWLGELYLVAVYSRALDAAEVEQNYDAGPNPPVQPPVAGFSAAPLTGTVPLTVTFTDQSTGTVDSRLWDFGDGITLTVSTLTTTHTYTASGVYTVALTVEGPAGSDTLTRPEYITVYQPVSLTRAFAFGADTWTRATYNEPSVSYVKVEQDGQNFTYSAAQGHGYVDTTDIDLTPNNRGVYSGDDELYDQFIGVWNGGDIVFRIDLPDGRYRFAAAGGDGQYYDHSTTVEVQDGDDGQVLTLVKDYQPAAAGHFWTVEFDDKAVPPADGVGADPTFVPQDDSGTLTVTQGYLQVIQGVGAGASNGGDLCLLEVWEITGGEAEPVAGFTAAPLSGTVPLTVTFTNLSTPTQAITSALWVYGDGVISSTLALTHTHTYTASGVYTVSLTASGPGGSDTLTRTNYITVSGGDTTPPTISHFSPWGFITETLPTFQATISDGLGSGVEAGDITMTLDSQAVDFDYHADSGVITYTPSVSLTEEYHTVFLEAEDRAGNQAEPVTWTVRVNVSATVGIVDPETAYALEPPGDLITVTVEFPAGAVTQTASVMYQRWGEEEEWNLLDNDPNLLFGLKALYADGRELTNFAQPVTLTVQYGEKVEDDLSEESLKLYTRPKVGEEEEWEWEEIPGQSVYTDTNLIVALLDHLSSFNVSGDPAEVVLPTLKAFEPDLYSGSLTFNYDLEVPVGAGGLAPRLTLRYSSATPNGLLGQPWDTGWVGVGWSFDVGSLGGKYVQRLVLNGVSEEIRPVGDGRYRTKNETFLDIRPMGGYWAVIDKDGTTYYFGRKNWRPTTHPSEGDGSRMYQTWFESRNDRCRSSTGPWKLDMIKDVHGNTVEIEYRAFSTNNGRSTSCNWDTNIGVKEAYPRFIRYTTNLSKGDDHAEYVIEFVISEKGFDTRKGSRIGDTAWKLDEIKMWYIPSPGAQGQLIRRYHFDISCVKAGQYDQDSRCLLTGITQYGANGSPLPSLSLSYQNLGIRYYSLPKRWDSWDALDYRCSRPFLVGVTNGYGGQVDFAYLKQWIGWERQFLHRELLQTKTVQDGFGQSAGFTYGYDNAAYKKGNVHFDFIGFRYATETDPLGHVSQHWFHAQQNDTRHPLNGRRYQVQREDGVGQLYEQVTETYTYTAGAASKSYFVYLEKKETSTYDGQSPPKQTEVTYTYDDWGNVEEVKEYDQNDNLYRWTLNRYVLNLDAWIVDKVSWQDVFDGSGGQVARTDYYYDRDGGNLRPFGSTPIRGDLVAVKNCGLGTTADSMSETWYDAYGNPVQAQDANGNETTTSYDDPYGHHSLPVAITNALGQTSTAQYDYRFGLATQVTDPNDLVTEYDYDQFGRLVEIWQPGDNGQSATVVYDYVEGHAGEPSYVYAGKRDDPGGSSMATYLESWQLYDGLGRMIQSQAESDQAGQLIVSDTEYDELGRQKRVSVPYEAGGSGGTWLPPSWGAGDTAYQYDPMGRVTKVTNPDGTYVSKDYDRWRTTTVDENGHQKVHETDDFGRLVKVEEYQGTGSYTLYATTQYGYDVLDNLTSVTDAQGHQTTMTYDKLGRKRTMDDPDMGHWTYTYDGVGNLLTQTDAKGQIIRFGYDGLNRLTAKDYGDDSTDDVTYHYDEPDHGQSVGQRTSMVDPSGSTAYYYQDTRGRLTREEKHITGAPKQPYVTQYTYDDLDRVLTMTYPDNEVVSNAYDARGMLESLGTSWGGNYVQDMTYNALGQTESMALGNGLTTSYDYYTAAEDNNRLKRINVLTLLDLTYTYDDVGNVQTIADATLTQTQSFGYDFLNRLTSAQADGSQGAYAHSYAYDQIGNITDLNEVAYSYQGSQPHAVTDLSDGSHFEYDANGNMTLRVEISGTQVITYQQGFDIENRLAVVTDTLSGEVTRFLYDGDGVRVKKEDSGGATYYVGNYYEEFVPQGSGPTAWLTEIRDSRFEKGQKPGRNGLAAPLKSAVSPPDYEPGRSGKELGEDKVLLENDRYRAEFDENGLHFTARGDDGQTASLSYRLSTVRSGRQVYFDSFRWAGSGCPANAVLPCHCEEQSDEAIPAGIEPRLSGDGRVVRYRRPHGISEEYVAGEKGVEQVFVLSQPLELDGDLEVVGWLDSELEAVLVSSAEGVVFLAQDGRVALRYGRALVYDSAGREVRAELHLEGTALSIVVPQQWLAEATYPVTVDPPIEGSNFYINQGAGMQSMPDVAYNSSTDQEFLVVWQGTSGIYGQRVAYGGTLLGGQITITGSGSKPAVAYNSNSEEYLVVWEDFYQTAAAIFAQRLSATGALVGERITVSYVASIQQHSPDVACDPANNRYLVVWERKEGTDPSDSYDVYGRTVSATGSPGSDISICVRNGTDQEDARVAYNSATGGYLVVWRDKRIHSDGDVHAQRVNGDGELPESNFPIETNTNTQKGPTAACSGGPDGCLVAWYENDDVIYGRLIPNSGSPTAPRFEIINAGGNQKLQDVAYHPGLGEYMVVWTDHRTDGGDTYGRRVAATGGTLGADFAIGTASNTQEYPAVAYIDHGSDARGYLAVWQDNDLGDVYGQRVYDQTPPAVPVMTPEPSYSPGTANTVSWGAASDAGVGGVEYRAQRADNAGFSSGVVTSGWINDLSYTFTGLYGSCHLYYYRVRARDAWGNTTAWSSAVSSIQDAVDPTGSVTVNGGQEWTASRSVSLALSAADTCAGVAEMRFSNDGSTWSDWQSYSTSADWTLSSGDGLKTVYVQFKDAVGNISTAYTDTIHLDQTPPPVPAPQAEPPYTPGTSNTIAWSAVSDAGVGGVEYRAQRADNASFSSGVVTGNWTSGLSDTFTGLQGSCHTYYYHLQSRDALSNTSAWSSATSSTQDAVVPTAGSVTVNGGQEWTASRSVSLALSAADTCAGVAEMRFSNDGSAWSGWQSYSTSANWTLSSGDGLKTVYAQFRDAAGNTSTTCTDTIHLDQTPPPVPTPQAEPPYTPGVTNTIAWSAVSDAGVGGVVEYRAQRADNLSFSSGVVTSGWINDLTYTFTGLDGSCHTYYYHLQSRDALSNTSAWSSAVSSTQDAVAPTGSVIINDGWDWTASLSVTLTLSVTDGCSGMADMRFSNDGSTWSGWQSYSTSADWTLTSGEGLKTVYAQFRDALVNESDVYSDTIAVEWVPPVVSTYQVVEDTIYAHAVSTDTVWYGNAGPPPCSECTFAVRVTADDATSGLDRAAYPETVSAGGVYTTALSGDYQYEHGYTFDLTDTISGTYPVTVYDRAGNSAETGFTVWRDATPPPAPTDPLINGGETWDQDGTVTLTWGPVSDGQSGLEGYYAAFGDPTPTVRADTTISDTETWTGADTPAAPYYVRARDNVGNWGVVASDTIGIDTMPPLGSVHSITETSPYAYGSGDTAYYNSAGSGSFAVRVAAEDTGSGLDQATYPETTSPGAVYYTTLDEEYQYQHTYNFDETDTASGTYTVTLQDGIGRQSSVDFSVIRDTTPPTLTLEAVVQRDVLVAWSATDPSPGSGLDTSNCLLKVREDDEGTWQAFSTDCGGDDTYDGQPGYTYTFRLSASDNVSNAASTEVEAVVPYVTKYYYANGQRVAMQKEGVVYYVHSDHLGSTSLTTCGSQDGCDGTPHQGVVARQLYHPYGEVRWSEGTLPTDYGFTGQRLEAGLGLMHYGARFYSPRLGRFISPDTVVPNPLNPQDFNRYIYSRNSPLVYIDADGHFPIVPVLIGLTIATAIWLAYPRIAEAPAPGEVLTPPDYDPGYGDKALLDAAPGTGDISDAYAVITGRRLFTGDPQSRLEAGIFTALPVAGGVTAGLRHTDDAARAVDSAADAFRFTPRGDEIFEVGLRMGSTEEMHWIPRQFHGQLKEIYPQISEGLLEFTEPLERGFHKFVHGKWGTRADSYNDLVRQWLNEYGGIKSLDDFLQYIDELRSDYLDLYEQYLTGS